jgi:spore coat polysaccharide biosynthesis protein SpsF (cytidylyltransferase family)
LKIVGLIQAHHRGWGGAQDFSLAQIDGRYAIEHVIERLAAMAKIEGVTIAVPDEAGNAIFRDIAARHGVSCFFGSRENVLERCAGALDAMGADIAVHVMGQHCFVDPQLLSDMLAFREAQGAQFVSLPDSFTPYFAGKIYTRALLDDVAAAIQASPAQDQALHAARFAAFVEHQRETFHALVYENTPRYDRDYLLKVRDIAQQIFTDDRMHVEAGEASAVSNPLFESYELAAGKFGASDRILDIACGDGYGCRILSGHVGEILGIDINEALIAGNIRENATANVRYAVDNAFDLSLPDGAVHGATAMELIEHLPLDQVDVFVKEVRRVVRPGGLFVCSTPQNSFGDIPVVPWHVKEYAVDEFKTILGRQFSQVKIFSSKSGGGLAEGESGQKMVALCR